MPHPEVGTNRRGGPEGKAKGTAKPNQKAAPPTPHYIVLHEGEDEEAEFDLGPPPVLGPDVEQFFHGPAGKYEEDAGNHFPAEPPMEEYEKWVEWRG